MGTESHTLPAMLGKPKGHPVYRFDRGLSAAELRGLQPDIDEAMGAPEEGAGSEDEEEEEEEVDPPPVPRPARKIPVKTKADERFSGGDRWPPAPAGKGVWLLAEGPDIGKEVDLVAALWCVWAVEVFTPLPRRCWRFAGSRSPSCLSTRRK